MMTYQDLLIWQYRQKPNARATIALIEQEIAQGFQDLFRLQNVLNIEEATYHQLDLVGKHVGQLRLVRGYELLKFFGFKGSPIALGFSRQGQGGGKWYRYRAPLRESQLLEDDDYRFLIKCRILKNYQTGTLPDILNACHFVFGKQAQAVDNEDMSVTVSLPGKELSYFKRFAIRYLDIIPRAAGVHIHFNLY